MRIKAMETIRRSAAEAEDGQPVPLYRDRDVWLRYESFYDEVDAEGAALPAETWRDGYWDATEYIVEACEVGIYDRVDAIVTMSRRYTDDKSIWTFEQMRDEVFPAEIDGVDMDQFIGGELSFEDWISESLNVGIYRKVDFMEYRDEDEGELVIERLVMEE